MISHKRLPSGVNSVEEGQSVEHVALRTRPAGSTRTRHQEQVFRVSVHRWW